MAERHVLGDRAAEPDLEVVGMRSKDEQVARRRASPHLIRRAISSSVTCAVTDRSGADFVLNGGRCYGAGMRIHSFTAALCLVATGALAQRLPAGVSPEHYSLWFAPDLEKATFRGRETIAVNVAAPTSAITLHAAEITFGEVTIEAGGKTQPAKVTLNDKDETATFTVPARRCPRARRRSASPTPAFSTTSCAAST